MLARWTVRPIQLSIQQGGFSGSDIALIKAAADTWNSFFQTSVGSPVFDYGGSDIRQSATPYPSQKDLSNEKFVQAGQFVTSVVLYPITDWYSTKYEGTGKSPFVIAETQSYHVDASPIATFTSASIAVNYTDYFVSSKKVPDLQTILTHELGHLLGLKHSCASSTDPDIPLCSSYPDFAAAVLRPQFGFSGSAGERVRDLTENDESRANCLYK